MRNTFILISFIFMAPFKYHAEQNKTFVVFGHGYSTLVDKNSREDFINEINKTNPKLVFILGDSELHKNDVVMHYKSKLKAKVFFSPGNTEVQKGNLDKYLANVGYLDTILKMGFGNFIILNSLASSKNINLFLKNIIKNVDTLVPTFILTHHRIWDDNLISPLPYEHDKSYLFRDIDSNLILNCNYIIAGNSPTQYFGYKNSQSPYNTNICYWLDVVKNINCYSMGMKNKCFFNVIKVFDKEILIKPVVTNKLNSSSAKENFLGKGKNKKIRNYKEFILYLSICVLVFIIVKMRKKLRELSNIND